MVLKYLLGIWMSLVIVVAFTLAPPAAGFTESRIIFFHVPCAMVAALGFVVSTVYAVRYLMRKNPSDDAKSAISAELGLLFAFAATVTGSIFARMEWGSWWNWDARETSIVILLVVYAAYFALRSSVENVDKRASLSAVYGVLAVFPMVFLMFVVPRMVVSLHPGDTLTAKAGLSPEYRIILYSAAVGFVGLYVWIFRIKTALAEIKLKLGRN